MFEFLRSPRLKKQKNGRLAEKDRMTFLTILVQFMMQCAELFLYSIAHFQAKLGTLEPSNNRNRNLENLEAAAVSSLHVRQGFFVLVNLCFPNPMVFSLFSIIVDTIIIASRVYCPLHGLDSFRKQIRNCVLSVHFKLD